MEYRELSDSLREIGWNQSEFARRADVDTDTVTRWKRLGRCPEWVRGFIAPRVGLANLYRRHIRG